MQNFNSADYQLFTSLVKLSPQALLKLMRKYIAKKYSYVISTDSYLVAEGEIPVALVAHVDTVFETTPKNIYRDNSQGVIWSPEGLGADDRAGVFAILKIIQSGFKPTIILTTGEEEGGVGAEQLIKDIPICPIPELKYIIELDRRGTCDCVFYDCDNEDFIQYVESFGFIQNFGSFSDISIICPAWKIAGVNLSIGYENEHSYIETLHTNAWTATVKKVQTMLAEKNIPKFIYIEAPMWKWEDNWGFVGRNYYSAARVFSCHNCGKPFEEIELFPTYDKKKKIKYYCPDCCVNRVDWCNNCGTAYEKKLSHCPECGAAKEII